MKKAPMKIMGNAEELEQKYGNERKAPKVGRSMKNGLGQKCGNGKKAPMEIMGNAEELEQTYGIERKTPT